jgi:PAS domain S-box-containing protein
MFKQILDTSSVAIFLVDMEGRITQANRRMAEMFGYSTQSLLEQEYVALVDPAQREVAREMMLALLASAIPMAELDRLYWRADHSTFWGHLSGRRFFSADGTKKGLIGVIADIDDSKQADEKLLQHDAMLSAIIENFPGGISMIDASMRFTAHNMQFRRLLDFPDALLDNPNCPWSAFFASMQSVANTALVTSKSRSPNGSNVQRSSNRTGSSGRVPMEPYWRFAATSCLAAALSQPTSTSPSASKWKNRCASWPSLTRSPSWPTGAC